MDTINENGEFQESRDLRFELEPGQVIEDRYEVMNKLGSGATASVYRCKDKLLGNLQVAIKIFRYNKNLTEEVQTRLSREIWASFGINHGNVARFYECIRNENILGLVMEYIDGQTLEDFLEENGRLNPGQVKYVLEKLCSGVLAMHDQGVLHRDLKPANVMVSRSGAIVITDLGLAKNAPTIAGSMGLEDSSSKHIYSELSRESQEQTSQGDVVGTPLYLAPEYLMEGIADISCDVYALGIIAYELITGEAPFDGEPLYKFLIRKVKEDPIEPHKLRRKCPPALSRVIMEAISRSPSNRFADAREFLRAVESLKIPSIPIVTITKEDRELLEAYVIDDTVEDEGALIESLTKAAVLCMKIVWGLALLCLLTFGVLVFITCLLRPTALNALLQGDFQTVLNSIKLLFK